MDNGALVAPIPMAKSVWKKMVGGVRRILPSSSGDVNLEPKNIGSPMNPRREFHVTINDDGSANGLPATMDKDYRVSEKNVGQHRLLQLCSKRYRPPLK